MIDFKKLQIYSLAQEVEDDIYAIIQKLPFEEKYNAATQLRRSVSSIGANIAEGAGRRTRTDFNHFLFIALGSINETQHFLSLITRRAFVESNLSSAVSDKLDKLGRMVTKFIKSASHI